MENTLVSVYLTHLLLQLQLAELDFRNAESSYGSIASAADLVDRRGDELLRNLRSVCAGGKTIVIHMNSRLEIPHSVRSVDSIEDRHRLIYRPLDNETQNLATCDLVLASRVEVPLLGVADSRFLTEAAFHGVAEDER